MSFNLSATVPLQWTLTDPDGTPVNADAVTVTITLPDGTIDTQPVSPAGVGDYRYAYPSVQAGRHVARWIATGSNASAYTDAFDVEEADPGQLVSLKVARNHLNITKTKTSDDAELQRMLQSVTGPVERIIGDVVRRQRTDTFSGGHPVIALPHFPVLQVDQITENGTPVDATGYRARLGSGLIARMSGGAPVRWATGVDNIVVTYTTGRIIVSADARQAVLVILQHLWETQRGGFNTAPRDSDTYDPRFGYSIPRRAIELLGEPIPGFA